MPEVTTTYLEMTSREQLHARGSDDSRFDVSEALVPQWQVNRFLYRYIGEQWDWADKRSWPDERWQRYVAADLRTWLGFYGGSIAGYFELHRANGEVEIAYFGLTPEFIGRGFGGALLTRAIAEAWDWNATRVWVHTCTLDHPAALRNYQARGMRIYKTVAEQRAG